MRQRSKRDASSNETELSASCYKRGERCKDAQNTLIAINVASAVMVTDRSSVVTSLSSGASCQACGGGNVIRVQDSEEATEAWDGFREA